MQKLNIKLDYDPEKDGFTQSLLSAWKECPSKARAKIQALYRPGGASKALMFGSVFHAYDDVIKQMYNSGSYFEFRQFELLGFNKILKHEVFKQFDKEYIDATSQGKDIINYAFREVQVLFVEYMKYWNSDFFGKTKKDWVEVEGEFKVRVAGGLFRGKRDGVYRDALDKNLHLFETKTKARWNTETIMMLLPIEFQVLTYILAYYLEHGVFLKGVLYNIVRRPQLRQKVSESDMDFLARIQVDIRKRKEHYFERVYCPIPKEDVVHFSRTFSKLTLDFAMWARANPIMDEKNTNACVSTYGDCPFLERCSTKGKVMSTLQVKDKLFSELG